ncbi:MAG: Slp family lipoprotein [Proteobacteria bacterium]|nr:Slp family lipoprotein [Pseudomonadota bacterium]
MLAGKRHSIIVLAALAAGCTPPPSALRGRFADVRPLQAATGQFDGTDVRWGGVVTGLRAMDRGTCLEIAWYATDRQTLRPAAGGGTNANGPYHRLWSNEALLLGGRTQPPRFLACGDGMDNPDRYFRGSVVSITGVIATPAVYSVASANCGDTHNATSASTEPHVLSPGSHIAVSPRGAPYTASAHQEGNDPCLARLPVVEVAGIHVWDKPFPPSVNQPWPPAASFVPGR